MPRRRVGRTPLWATGLELAGDSPFGVQAEYDNSNSDRQNGVATTRRMHRTTVPLPLSARLLRRVGHPRAPCAPRTQTHTPNATANTTKTPAPPSYHCCCHHRHQSRKPLRTYIDAVDGGLVIAELGTDPVSTKNDRAIGPLPPVPSGSSEKSRSPSSHRRSGDTSWLRVRNGCQRW